MNTKDKIIDTLIEEGGRPFFVGGCVRDSLLGIPPKDFDIEVFGLSLENLASILSRFGKTDLVGQSFGIVKFKSDDFEADFSIPRRESKSGVGHREFFIEVDPTMTQKEAAARRDFTWNALSRDAKTGEIFDFFGGQSDLQNRIIRHTSEHFVEDPLRPLRAMQFAGRFDMTICLETSELCRQLLPEFDTLPKDRVWEEFRKWTKSVKPSSGMDVLKQIGWTSAFPELHALIGLDQDPIWHPEGDAWVHTIRATDFASRIVIRDNLEGEDAVVLLLATLCHDFGKPLTTEFEDGHIRSRRHAKEGVEPTKKFLDRIGAPNRIVDRVVPLVKEHMVFCNNVVHESTVRRLSVRLHPETVPMLVRVIESDHGSKSGELWPGRFEVLDMAKKVDVDRHKPKPILMGRHLIPMGISPGPEMGSILREAFEVQLDGGFSDEMGALEWATKRLETPQ